MNSVVNEWKGKEGKRRRWRVEKVFYSFLYLYFHSFLFLFTLCIAAAAAGFVGRGTLTFDEFCRVAVHFSDEDDEALQLSLPFAISLEFSTQMGIHVYIYNFFLLPLTWAKIPPIAERN